MVELAGAAVTAILTRAPSSGGKTRLFAALGRDTDPALLEALLLDTVEASEAPGIVRVVAVEPPAACGEVGALLRGVEVIPQPPGTLGERMAGVMRVLFGRGARAVALVGSDLPDLDARAVAEAFAVLDRDPDAVVLGPSADGGYYLLAATRLPPLFDGIEWGTDRVLAATLARASECGLAVRLLHVAADVDTPADLRRVRAHRTRSWAESHAQSE